MSFCKSYENSQKTRKYSTWRRMKSCLAVSLGRMGRNVSAAMEMTIFLQVARWFRMYLIDLSAYINTISIQVKNDVNFSGIKEINTLVSKTQICYNLRVRELKIISKNGCDIQAVTKTITLHISVPRSYLLRFLRLPRVLHRLRVVHSLLQENHQSV